VAELLPEEEFEDAYTLKFRQLLQGRGLPIQHSRDRFGIDLGIQLSEPESRTLTNVRVWFQLKGLHSSSYSAAQLVDHQHVAVPKIALQHLRNWYAAPEATYLVVYLEASDTFIAEDVRDIVDRQWGQRFLAPDTFLPSQRSVTLQVVSSAVLTRDRLDGLLSHRSMRIDGPAFRGRPLGHRLDPLRSQLDVLDPGNFSAIVLDLLLAHGYSPELQLRAGALLELTSEDDASLTIGTFTTTWEWVFQMGTEFGYGEDEAPRSEGQVFRAFGKMAVLIHSNVTGRAKASPTAGGVRAKLRERGVSELLIFANAPDISVMGPYREAAGELWTAPHGLGTLAYNMLTATLVYLNHQDELRWQTVNYNYES